jgi:hypothetical protein
MEYKKYSTVYTVPLFDTQELKGAENLEDEEYEPAYLAKLYVNNIFQRSLAHLYGFYEGKWRRVAVDANGNLLITSTETAIQKYDVIKVTAGDTESVALLFTFPSGITVTRVVEVYTTNAPVLIRFIPYDDTVLEQRTLPANSFYSVVASIKGFKVQNAIAGSNATVEVVGWY